MNAKPVTSTDVDALVVARGLTLRDVRAAVPDHLMKPVAWRSWLTLARVLACCAAGLFLLSQVAVSPATTSPVEWVVLGAMWLLHGLTLLGLFGIGHDAGHGSFSRSRWVNTVVGYVVMSPLCNGFHTWRVTHNSHHALTQLKGQEVDWAAQLKTREELAALTWREAPVVKLGYALPFGLFMWLGYNTMRRGVAVRQVLSPAQYERERSQLILSNLIMLGSQIALGAVFVALTGWWGLVKFHLVPAWIAGLFGGLIVAVGHAHDESLLFDREEWTGARGQLSSTYNVRFYRWVEWLILDLNVHIPHHVSTRIPWYHLREAGDAIRVAFPELYQERRFQPSDMAWCVRTPVLERNEEAGYYQLTPR